MSHPDHQPLAILEEDGTYRPGCLCGWRRSDTFEQRCEAHALAYVHDRQMSE